MVCILVTALATIVIGIALALFAYDRAAYLPLLPDDGNMSGAFKSKRTF